MHGSSKAFFVLGCLNLALTIVLGAVGAHALHVQLAMFDPGGWFATALRLHEIHALGLIVLGLARARGRASCWFVAAGLLMLLGLVLFCGGLYWLALYGVRLVPGGIPAGGVSFMLAWLALAIGGWRWDAPAADAAPR